MKPERSTEEIRDAAARDEALNMLELSVATGFSYTKIRTFAARPGFPRRLKKVVPSEFRAWLLTQPVDAPVRVPVAAAA